MQNRRLEGGGGGEKVASAVVGGLWGVQAEQLPLGKGGHVWPGVSASGTCPGEIVQSHSCKKARTGEELIDGSYFL